MKETLVKQHYVPACYLANFGINGNQGRNSNIYYKNIKDDSNPHLQARISSLNKFPTEKKFYDIPEFRENEKLLEQFFSEIEKEYAALLRKTLEYAMEKRIDRKYLTIDDRKALVAQFAVQIVRTKYRRQFYEYLYTAIVNAYPNISFPYLDEKDFKRMHNIEILRLRMVNFYANLLEDRNWVFLINHTKEPFFTSDNPAIFINNSSDASCSLSPASPEMTFYIPLSPDIALELYSKEIVKKSEIFFDIYNFKNINWYNINLKDKCSRFMMSNQSDFSYIEGSNK